MAEALNLSIVLQSEDAQRAIENFRQALQRTGFDAETVARQVSEFERSYAKAATTSEKAAESHRTAGAAANEQGQHVSTLTTMIMRYAGPAALGAALRGTIDFADSIKTLSQQSGFSTDAVQTLGHVAEKAGSSFQAVANAANILDRNLSVGSKTTKGALRDIGLSIDDLLSLQPEERFREVGIAIGSTADPAQRAEVAMALFGRSGSDLLPMFQELAEGAEQYAPRMSSAWVDHMAKVQSATQTAFGHLKNLGMWLLTFPIHQTMSAWDKAVETFEDLRDVLAGTVSGVPGAPGRPSGLPAAGLPGLNPLNGQSMGFWERVLTQGAQAGIRSNTTARNGLVTPFTAEEWRRIFTQPQALASAQRSIFLPPGFGTFPGFAAPPLPNSMDLSFGGHNVNGTGAFMLRPTVAMNAPGGGGGGFGGFLRSGAGRAVGMGLSFLPGLIPGLSQTGSSIGAAAGSALGSLSSIAGTALAPFLGPLGGLLGGGLGKLFGNFFGGEGKKTNRTRDAFITDNFGSVDALRDAAEKAGFSVDKLLSVKKVKDFEAEVKKLNKAISDSEADAQRTEEAMARWGLSIEDMGPKFKQTKLNDTFKEAMEDLRVLTDAGADFNVVAEKMAPQLGAMVHEAIEMGGTVPREMEPILKKMIELGVLTDKNGEKFTDISQIPFAQDLNKDFGELIAKMDKLISKIGALPGLFHDATGAANQFNNSVPDGSNLPGAGDPGFDAGGIVGMSMRGRSRRDVIPAWLRPGEMVVTPQRASGMRGGGGVSVVVNVAGYLDSQSARQNLGTLVREELGKELRRWRAA